MQSRTFHLSTVFKAGLAVFNYVLFLFSVIVCLPG